VKWLVDTSVWIEHLRSADLRLATLLRENQVLTHSAIIGELACGRLPKRREMLEAMSLLPSVREATAAEVLRYVDTARWYGRGIGWVDAQLLVSARLSDAQVWTLDRRMDRLARATRSS
jgi:predicted nucleic acid-binding protein